ncbi:MAG: peptide deformylase [Methylacidiphilales bacterium]|nr:peptide deformylase [Candidatus Methylacidiphilales bacterium]
MVLPIIRYGNPVLRRKGALIEKITPEIRQLAQDMIDTMHEAEGVGLAAQQAGHALQLAVIHIPSNIERPSKMWIGGKEVDLQLYMPLVLINPKLALTKKKEIGSEGCLSFPGITAEISRGYRVKVQSLNLEGKPFAFEAAGLLGRAVQHEADHLNGVLFIDRMTPEDREALKDEIESIRIPSK